MTYDHSLCLSLHDSSLFIPGHHKIVNLPFVGPSPHIRPYPHHKLTLLLCTPVPISKTGSEDKREDNRHFGKHTFSIAATHPIRLFDLIFQAWHRLILWSRTALLDGAIGAGQGIYMNSWMRWLREDKRTSSVRHDRSRGDILPLGGMVLPAEESPLRADRKVAEPRHWHTRQAAERSHGGMVLHNAHGEAGTLQDGVVGIDSEICRHSIHDVGCGHGRHMVRLLDRLVAGCVLSVGRGDRSRQMEGEVAVRESETDRGLVPCRAGSGIIILISGMSGGMSMDF